MAWGYKASSYAESAGKSVLNTNNDTLQPGVSLAVGDRIVLCVQGLQGTSGGGAPTYSVSDSLNGTYTEDAFQTLTTYPTLTSQPVRHSVFSKTVTTAGRPTITCTVSIAGSGVINLGLQVAAYTGLLASDPGKDVSAAATGSGTTSASSGATGITGAASELVLCSVMDSGEGTTIAAGSGFTARGTHQNDSGFYQGIIEDKDSGTSGTTQTGTATYGAAPSGWFAIAVVYKLAGGGGPSTYPITVSCTQAQSLSLVRAVSRTLSLTQAQSLSLARAFSRTISLTQTQSLTIVASKVFLRVVSATQAQSVALGGAGGSLRRTLGQGQSVALARGVRLPRALTQSQSVFLGLSKLVGQTRATAQAQSLSVTVQKVTLVSRSLTQTQSLALTRVGPLPSNFYTSTFPLTENPINESGVWTDGLATGLDWANPRTTTNKAFGTQTGNEFAAAGNYNDSVACLKGVWGNDQQAQATVFNTVVSGSAWAAEVECLARFTITAHSAAGYEANFSCNGRSGYCTLVRWNGPLNNFTTLNTTFPGAVHAGDVVRLTVIGSVITAYINGTQVNQVTDSGAGSIATGGSPGLGTFLANDSVGGGGDPTAFGLSQYTAQTVFGAITLTRSLLETTSLSLASQVRQARALGQAQAVSITVQKVILRTVTLTQAQVATVVVAARRTYLLTVTLTQAQTLSRTLTVRRTFVLAVSLAQPQVASLTNTAPMQPPGPVGTAAFSSVPGVGTAVHNPDHLLRAPRAGAAVGGPPW